VNDEAAMPPLIVIGGATATGKTELAIRLAEALTAEGRPTAIISADSRQVFRGLDIGTAKVTAADRARAPHFGLDLVEPDQPFSVADFVRHAQGVLTELQATDGHSVAILVGGTGLYLRAVGRGIDTAALPSDPDLRVRLEADLLRDGLPAMVDRRNKRRVVRALEIAELAGDRTLPAPRGYAGPSVWLGLTAEPAAHGRWIANRARAQFHGGLIDEAAKLRERFDVSLPAFSAIGYREAWAVLDGQLTREGAIELDARRNVAFAKRQRTWFRAEPGITWLDATDGLPDARVLELARAAIDAASVSLSRP
jgi:tRNA dimethylallyltransferase